MYELNTGQLPFDAATLIGLINKHLFEDVLAPREVNPDLPVDLNDLILRLLSKDPQGRPANASNVQHALERFVGPSAQETETIEKIPVPTRISRHNLRANTSSFIGRQDDLNRIYKLISNADLRLLTLVGSGGIGKTRLATQAAFKALDQYPDGVWMVELASLTEAGLLPQRVADIFGVSAQEAREGQGETEVLVEFLKDKNLLLVIDNCEHLIEACAEFTDTLLKGCPQLRVMATSREDLRVPGETIYQVNPLILPRDSISVEDFGTSEAIQLFIERASAADRNFELSSENSAAVFQICNQLDGIPLAIELAAARIKILNPEQIVERLDDRFQLLTAGSRTALPRHQTLEAAIDWSYDLLSEQEQSLLRKLAVFSGGWNLEAAEKVDKFAAQDKFGVFDLLSQLVDKSLVSAEQFEETIRYRMLETVRQYGIIKLRQAGELSRARQNHINYFTHLAEIADLGLRDERQVDSLKILDVEHDNLRGAIRWSLNQVNADSAFRLIAALGWFWFIRGYWKESWIWLTQSLDLNVDSSPMLRAKAIIRAGGLELIRGKLSGTTDLVEEALVLSREVHDKENTAWCLNLLGQAGTWGYKEIDEAEAKLTESLEIFKELGDEWGIAWTLRYLGQVAEVRGDFEKSIALQREALNRFEAIGDIWNSAHSLYLLGGTLFLFGDSEGAKEAYQQIPSKSKIVEDKVMAAHAIRGAAMIALQDNDLDQAEQLYQDALVALQKIGDENCASGAIRDLGEIARRGGQYAQAIELLSQSLLSFVEMGNDVPIGIAIERFASLASSLGNYRKATQLLAAVEEHIGDTINSSPTLQTEHKKLISSAQDHFGHQVFEQYWIEGAEMSLVDAAALALKEVKVG